MTAIQVEVPDAFTGFQLTLRLREGAIVVPNGRGFVVKIDADDQDVHGALSKLRDGLASFGLATARVEVEGHPYLLEVAAP